MSDRHWIKGYEFYFMTLGNYVSFFNSIILSHSATIIPTNLKKEMKNNPNTH